jgi:hypothetical protein
MEGEHPQGHGDQDGEVNPTRDREPYL